MSDEKKSEHEPKQLEFEFMDAGGPVWEEESKGIFKTQWGRLSASILRGKRRGDDDPLLMLSGFETAHETKQFAEFCLKQYFLEKSKNHYPQYKWSNENADD